MGIKEQLQALRASGAGPPYRVHNEAGQWMLIADDSVARFFLSEDPPPQDNDLEQLFRGAVTVVVRQGIGTLLEVNGSERLAELRHHLRLCPAEMDGPGRGFEEPQLAVFGPEGLRGTLELHHGVKLRWQGKWNSDAELVDGRGLVEWLAGCGLEAPLRELEEDAARARDHTQALERCFQAMPICLEPLWAQIVSLCQRGADGGPLLQKAALVALAGHYASDYEVVLSLLAWLAHSPVAVQTFPITLLLAFPIESTIEALSAGEPIHLKGAARLLTSWNFERQADRSKVSTPLRQRLRSYLARHDPDACQKFDRLFPTVGAP